MYKLFFQKHHCNANGARQDLCGHDGYCRASQMLGTGDPVPPANVP